MTDLAPLRSYDLATIRRAIDSADPHGEAALNALLYAAAALLASAVILVITTPALLAVPVALVPWVVLLLFGWSWIAPALRDEFLTKRMRSTRANHAEALAADLLLDDDASEEHRRMAARYMLEPLDPLERDQAAEQLFRLGETEPH